MCIIGDFYILGHYQSYKFQKGEVFMFQTMFSGISSNFSIYGLWVAFAALSLLWGALWSISAVFLRRGK